MKKYLFFALIFFIICNINAQVVTYDDFRSIIPLMEEEAYDEAFKKSKQILNKTKNDSSDLRGIITYMNILASAGMVTVDKMTHSEFLKNAKKYKGQWIVMAAHPCIDSSQMSYNALVFVSSNDTIKGMITSSNKRMTNILCFEYFTFEPPVDPAELVGKNVRCGGILESIEVNPNGSKVWIARLHVKQAFAREIE